MSVTSLRITSMFGWAWIVSVTARGKSSRATPRAPPAGTGLASAQRRITDPRRLSSSLSSPEAVSKARFPSEFEHTSSAKCSVRWAGVSLRGRISHNSTKQPSSAACQAASLPASPAPMMVTFGIKADPPLVALQGGYSTPSQTRAPEGAIPSRAASVIGFQKPFREDVNGQKTTPGGMAYPRPEAARRLQYSESPFSPEVITLSWLWRYTRSAAYPRRLRAGLVRRTYQLNVMEVPSCCSWNRVSSTPLRSPLTVSLSLLSGSTSVYRQWMRKGGARRATSGAWCTRKETVLPTWRPSSSLSSTSSMSGHHSRTARREVMAS